MEASSPNCPMEMVLWYIEHNHNRYVKGWTCETYIRQNSLPTANICYSILYECLIYDLHMHL